MATSSATQASSNVPTLTQDQVTMLTNLYGPQIGAKAGTPLSQLAGSYLTMAGQGQIDQNTNDPVMQQLIQSGYLAWGSNAQGAQSLTFGPALQAAQDRLAAQGGQNFTTSLGAASSPFGVASTTIAADPGIVYQGPSLSKLLLQSVQSPNLTLLGWSNAPSQVGGVDPETGEALFNWSQTRPQATYDNSFLNNFIGSGQLAALLAAPMFLPLASEMGPLFSSLFKTAGNELLGNQTNPLASIMPIIQSQLGSG